MAKDLGVDQATVRTRIEKLQKSHVLVGWYLATSPAVSGHDVTYAWLKAEPPLRKYDITRRLLSIESVERVCDYFGTRMSFVLLTEHGSDSSIAFKRLAAAAGLSQTMRRGTFMMVTPRGLKATDAAIIESLRGDPWKPYSNVAKELGVSAKTVNRRVAQLADSGAIYLLPIIDLKALHGVIPLELVVDYSSGDSKVMVNRAVMSRVKDSLIFSDVSGPGGYFALAVHNISEVEQIAEWVKRQKGVRAVRAEALQDVTLNPKHYERSPSREITEQNTRSPHKEKGVVARN